MFQRRPFHAVSKEDKADVRNGLDDAPGRFDQYPEPFLRTQPAGRDDDWAIAARDAPQLVASARGTPIDTAGCRWPARRRRTRRRAPWPERAGTGPLRRS